MRQLKLVVVEEMPGTPSTKLVYSLLWQIASQHDTHGDGSHHTRIAPLILEQVFGHVADAIEPRRSAGYDFASHIRKRLVARKRKERATQTHHLRCTLENGLRTSAARLKSLEKAGRHSRFETASDVDATKLGELPVVEPQLLAILFAQPSAGDVVVYNAMASCKVVYLHRRCKGKLQQTTNTEKQP